MGFWQTSTNSFSLWGLWDVTVWQVETSGEMLPITLQEMKYGLLGTIHEGHHWPDVKQHSVYVCVLVCAWTNQLYYTRRHHILNQSSLCLWAVKIVTVFSACLDNLEAKPQMQSLTRHASTAEVQLVAMGQVVVLNKLKVTIKVGRFLLPYLIFNNSSVV